MARVLRVYACENAVPFNAKSEKPIRAFAECGEIHPRGRGTCSEFSGVVPHGNHRRIKLCRNSQAHWNAETVRQEHGLPLYLVRLVFDSTAQLARIG